MLDVIVFVSILPLPSNFPPVASLCGSASEEEQLPLVDFAFREKTNDFRFWQSHFFFAIFGT